jgi:hypothetical protein
MVGALEEGAYGLLSFVRSLPVREDMSRTSIANW